MSALEYTHYFLPRSKWNNDLGVSLCGTIYKLPEEKKGANQTKIKLKEGQVSLNLSKLGRKSSRRIRGLILGFEFRIN